MTNTGRYRDLARVKTALLSMQRYSWEQGVCAQAFLESGDMDTVTALCVEAVNRQTEDGRLANIGDQRAVTDPVAILEALVRASEHTTDPALKQGVQKTLDWALDKAPRSADGVIYHVDDAPQFWVDSLYMLPPPLLRAGYAEEAVRQADGYISRLYDPEKHMFRHIWDEDKQAFIRDAFWGVGNGWAVSGLARLIDGLPDGLREARDRYIRVVTQTVTACLAYKRDDDLFHDVLDRPDTFVEVNFPQMLTYTIKRGIMRGWLPEALTAEADKMRRAVHKQVTPHGFVQNVCGAPTFDKPGIAPEGQAFFLLMESMY